MINLCSVFSSVYLEVNRSLVVNSLVPTSKDFSQLTPYYFPLSVLGIFKPQSNSTATVRYDDEIRNIFEKVNLLYY